LLKHFFGINKDQKLPYSQKWFWKTTIMNIINGFDEPDTGQVICVHSYGFFISNNNLQDELTIEESILHQIMKL
jgi:ATP-binding cassette subfamily F protein uup